jgi:ABC-2 type transport system permease protein
MLWLGMLLGSVVRSPDAAQGIVFIVIFPLTFVANAFVPSGTLPELLQHVANWNPVSALAAGIRTLFGNPTATPGDVPWPLQHPVASSVIWIALLLTVTVPLALAAYGRRTDG